MTVRDLLYQAEERLAAVSETPGLDSKLLFMKASGMDEIAIITRRGEKVSEEVKLEFSAMVERRFREEPVAYITGTKGFMGLDFEVNPSCLIPRPETELIVETISKRLRKNRLENGEIRGLEIGLGSGVISVSLLKAHDFLKMTASDISEQALKTAMINAERYGVKSRLEATLEDLYDVKRGGNFDFLVSNPPYIAESEYEVLGNNVKLYEPKTALLADDEGLEFYKRISRIAPEILKRGGFIAFEIGCGQADAVSQILRENDFSGIEVLKDLAGKDRVVIGELR